MDLPAPPDDDDGDDYLTMSIAEPAVTGPETSMQRRARKIREVCLTLPQGHKLPFVALTSYTLGRD